ncbi:MAG: 4Fe-4S dicluster domain-containing protein [Thermoplasmata archaeon]|nr:MAG: 4Fe-4S dicluster domain-containing protein [Thermoplasmata archaeon]
MTLKKYQAEIETCFGTSCNFCERNCPVYKIHQNKTLTSRGKNRTALGILQGKVKASEKLAQALFQCTQCGSCERWCALPDTEIQRELRAYVNQEGFELEIHAANRDKILETGNPYGSPDKLAWQDKFEFSGDILFFGGCTQPIKQSELLETMIKLIGPENLKAIPEEPCCGSYLFRTGYIQEYEALRDKLVNQLRENNITEIVTSCAGCYSTLKHGLAEVMDDSVKVMHAIEKIEEMISEGVIKVRSTGKKITYHDPCHLGRLGEVFEPPREVIKHLGTLVEMEKNRFESQCCGAGGGVKAGFPALAEDMAKNRIEQAKSTGADILVTVCPFCELHLGSVGGMEVRNLIALVYENRIQ